MMTITVVGYMHILAETTKERKRGRKTKKRGCVSFDDSNEIK
jgi:hypothetical protein